MDKIKIIEELDRQLKLLLPLSEKQNEILQKKIRLEFNYNSNHIEGNTLTYAETELLLVFDETRGNHVHREYEEMKASDVAYKMIEELAGDSEKPLNENFIKQLNSALLVRPYWKDAITSSGEKVRRKILIGDYKKTPNSVLLDNGEMFEYAAPIDTPALMGDLIQWLRDAEKEHVLHPVEIAAELHYRFVRIHPFDDGNGRLSRLLMNYVLLRNKLPPVIIKSDDKKNYLSALRDADTGNLESFKIYIADELINSLMLSLKAANNENLEEEKDWKKKLTIIKKELLDMETIKIIKSHEIIYHFINKGIPQYIFDVLALLTDFDELFVNRRILVGNAKYGSTEISRKSVFQDELVRNFFYQKFELRIVFEHFNKSLTNAFSIEIMLEFQFGDLKFEMYNNQELLLTKLYHQDFSDAEIEFLVNYLGRELTTKIEANVQHH